MTTVIVYPLLSSSQQPSERGAVITPLATRPADMYWLAQGHTAGVQNRNSTPQGKLSAGPGRAASRQRLSLSALPTALHFLKNQHTNHARSSTEEEGISSVGSQGGLLEELTAIRVQELQHIEKQSMETSPCSAEGRTWSLPALRGPLPGDLTALLTGQPPPSSFWLTPACAFAPPYSEGGLEPWGPVLTFKGWQINTGERR